MSARLFHITLYDDKKYVIIAEDILDVLEMFKASGLNQNAITKEITDMGKVLFPKKWAIESK